MNLIIGATGTVGRALARRLSASNVAFRGLVRTEEKGRQLGCPYLIGDLDEPGSIASALQGVSRVFLNSSAGAALLRQQCAVIDAAKAAGVRQIVKLSTRGAEETSAVVAARAHAQVEAHLKSSGLDWTILRPGFFMQNFLRHADSIRGEGRFYGAFRDGKVAFLDVEDIAATAAVTLLREDYLGATLVLTGPDALTHAEAAATIGRLIGRQVAYVDLPVERMVGSMIERGMPAESARGLGLMMSAMAEGQAAYTTTTVREVTGVPARSFEQFVQSHIGAFQ